MYFNPKANAGFVDSAGRSFQIRSIKSSEVTICPCFFSAFSCIVTLPYLIVDYSPMTIAQLVILICAGIAAAGGQFSITAAYSYAPAREISVFDYTQIIFAALMGFIAFGDIPDKFSIIGYVIICSVSVAMFLYNRKEG